MATNLTALRDEANDACEVFEYLDALRESGVTNMLGAGPYVQEAFGYDAELARDLVLSWISTFDEAVTALERAIMATR